MLWYRCNIHVFKIKLKWYSRKHLVFCRSVRLCKQLKSKAMLRLVLWPTKFSHQSLRQQMTVRKCLWEENYQLINRGTFYLIFIDFRYKNLSTAEYLNWPIFYQVIRILKPCRYRLTMRRSMPGRLLEVLYGVWIRLDLCKRLQSYSQRMYQW